ncbi:MAG: hypothetical protein DI533_08430 [Cereibacter sphaeroides]|uniref:Lipoprotein n=1 Tax=Cereibacter sphaeroides TaxID=1063 RepID=A0A2W5SNW5_CERSP|nr:MAG: hypothetical protein DI533_08430 [Cereibacter sphaeroides]
MTAAHLLAQTVAFAILALPAMADPDITTAETSIGAVLVDGKGMTLYTFDADKDGKSACYDQCAQNWPPVMGDADDAPGGDYGLTERTDGSQQWTYKGMPLYTWVKDTKPGDVTGDGFKDVWHAAKP